MQSIDNFKIAYSREFMTTLKCLEKNCSDKLKMRNIKESVNKIKSNAEKITAATGADKTKGKLLGETIDLVIKTNNALNVARELLTCKLEKCKKEYINQLIFHNKALIKKLEALMEFNQAMQKINSLPSNIKLKSARARAREKRESKKKESKKKVGGYKIKSPRSLKKSRKKR